MRIYYWLVIFISIGILGWSLDSFEKRWQSIQNYNDNPRNITLLILWCIATIPSIILLSDSSNSRICSSSSYAYKVPSKLLRHCNAYLASLLLAYIFIFSTIIQLLFGFTIVKHQKEISMKPPPISIFQPKKMKVRRSKRVNKKRNSLKSSTAFSNGTRLSIVTEDEEEKTRSTRSGSKNNRSVTSFKHEFSSEMQVNSNV
ncbi:hypothetical protein C1645_758459 [Glomus cerebriforme]|uniref:Uncharacterized protein n=1 Tax=Glomus cerebriforme TaxID=658196 RepID=A0A397T9Y1_9GLOM|nr:hypothetical protein C1645_758459 [Glomus cerebriforme]